MARMVRKQVYITPEQDRLLKRRARQLGVSEAELIRQGIDLTGQVYAAPRRDPDAFRALIKDMRKRQRLHVPQTGRTWTREELYDERLDRYAR